MSSASPKYLALTGGVGMTQSDQDVPFDIRSIRYLPYLGNTEGLAALMSSVRERLETLKARGVN